MRTDQGGKYHTQEAHQRCPHIHHQQSRQNNGPRYSPVIVGVRLEPNANKRSTGMHTNPRRTPAVMTYRSSYCSRRPGRRLAAYNRQNPTRATPDTAALCKSATITTQNTRQRWNNTTIALHSTHPSPPQVVARDLSIDAPESLAAHTPRFETGGPRGHGAQHIARRRAQCPPPRLPLRTSKPHNHPETSGDCSCPAMARDLPRGWRHTM